MPAAHSSSRDDQKLALYSKGLLGTDKVSVIERYPQVAGLYDHLDFRAFASEAGGEQIVRKKLPKILGQPLIFLRVRPLRSSRLRLMFASCYSVFFFRGSVVLTLNCFLVSYPIQFMFVLMKFLEYVLVNMSLLKVQSIAIFFQNPVLDRFLQDFALSFQHFRITQFTSSFPIHGFKRQMDFVYLAFRAFNITSDVTFTIIQKTLVEPNADQPSSDRVSTTQNGMGVLSGPFRRSAAGYSSMLTVASLTYNRLIRYHARAFNSNLP